MKVGIGVDNYKLSKYKKKLKNKGYKFEVKNGVTADTKLIQVEVEQKNLHKIQEICEELERYFATFRHRRN